MSIYLSQIINQPVWDARGQRLGRCTDILVMERESGAPRVAAVAMAPNQGEQRLIPAERVAWIKPAVILRNGLGEPYQATGHELRLRGQVMDRQIVDIEGRQLVRVNDLQLARNDRDERYYLTGVAVGTAGLLRRLGIESLIESALRLVGRDLKSRVIPWHQVAPVQPDAPIRLKVTRDKIQQMDPVDLAEIISELDLPSGMALLESLDMESVADAMQEIGLELQGSVLAAMPSDRAADVLEEMDPDDAADLLASLEGEERDAYLELMEEEESDEVERLLAYPEDTAGGIMTTEFTLLPAGLTAGEALALLRSSERAREDEIMYYVHITDEDGRLRGVVSLRDLVMADPAASVEGLMETHPIAVEPETSQRDVARLVARYDLLAVPVVDAEGVLQGIVTVDDAIDAVIPTAWKKRLPRFF